MRIVIEENENAEEVEIAIRCNQMTPEILRILALLETFNKKMTGIKDGRTFLIDVREIFYFDTIDKKTYLYTDKHAYEILLRLYEIEEQLLGGSFIRASKSSIINLSKIASFCPELSGRIEVQLENRQKLYVSRQYVPMLKKKLGL